MDCRHFKEEEINFSSEVAQKLHDQCKDLKLARRRRHLRPVFINEKFVPKSHLGVTPSFSVFIKGVTPKSWVAPRHDVGFGESTLGRAHNNKCLTLLFYSKVSKQEDKIKT